MYTTCPACATPLASTDRSCPACGAPAAFTRTAAESPTRRVILDPLPPPDTSAAPPSRAAVSSRRPVSARSTADRSPSRRSATGPAATGTVTGGIEQELVDAFGPREHRLVAAAAAVGLAAVVVLLVAGGSHRGSGLMFLLPTLLVLVAFLAAPFLVPRERARTPSRRFRLIEVSGRVHECELRGVPDADPLRAGDVLEVFGRHTGSVVRAEEIVRGDERMRGRSPLTFQIAHHAGVVSLALAVVCAVGVGVFVVTA